MKYAIKKYLSTAGSIVAWVAVLTEYYLIFGFFDVSAQEVTTRFFSFFTIWTNTLVAIYFTSDLLKPESRIHQFFQKPGMLTSITVYITLVGSVYQIVLRSIWTPHGLQIVADELLHSFIPVFVIVYWVLYEKRSEVQWKQIFRWLIFPITYLFLVMIRGGFSGWYPYPFLDLNKLNLVHLTINIIALLAYFFLLAALFAGIGKLTTKMKNTHTSN